jgi:hypothetical protein
LFNGTGFACEAIELSGLMFSNWHGIFAGGKRCSGSDGYRRVD